MSKILKNFVILLYFASIATFLMGCLETGSSNKSVKYRKVAYHLDAQVILDEYDANEIAADSKFKGKVIVVEGTVAKIESPDILSGPRVILEDEYSGLKCELVETEITKAAKLEKGVKVKIRGELSYGGKMDYCVFE